MKNTDTSFRSAIGTYNRIKLKPKDYRINYINCILDKFVPRLTETILEAIIIVTLLLIGNIESNPGPTPSEVEYDHIQLNLSKLSGSLNPIYATSVWGQLSVILFGKNTLPLRRFLMNFDNIFPKTNNEKYLNTSIYSIKIAMSRLDGIQDLNFSQNFVPRDSIWGLLAFNVYSSNSYEDRQFLSGLFNISMEVTDNPIPELSTKLTVTDRSRITTRKRKQQKEFRKQKARIRIQPVHPVPLEPEQDINPNPHTPSQQVIIQSIIQQYNKAVFQFAVLACKVCDSLMYPNLRKRFVVTNYIQELFYSIDKEQEPLESIITVCSRCHSSLTKGKIPPKAKCNGLALKPRPTQILNLTTAEIRLISQVKAYMKIFLTCKGRGQRAMKGMVIHFPNPVSEPIKILPLSPLNSDTVIVHETSDRSLHASEFKINPQSVRNALIWLVNNNPLYRDIQIDDTVLLGCQERREFSSVQIGIGMSNIINPENVEYNLAGIGYTVFSESFSGLHASFHQGNVMFGSNAGSQCTAMSASFLAHCFVDSPQQWTKQGLDLVLICGNDFYSDIRTTVDNIHLEPAEVVGNMTVFGGSRVNLAINYTVLPEYGGFLINVPGVDLPRLTCRINAFIRSDIVFGIITTRNYSMAIYVSSDSVFYFDSHSRGKKGHRAGYASGTAVLLKIRRSAAAELISKLVHRNCTERHQIPNNNNDYAFQITPFIVTAVVNSDTMPQDTQDTSLLPPSPLRKQIREDEDPDNDSDNDIPAPEETTEMVQDFGKVHNFDCVVDREDFIEPEIEELLKVNLVREARSPLNERQETSLDLLSFPHLFPYGINGLKTPRKIAITPLDYFQQRLMSNDERFIGNSDFLFYALSQCDAYRAREKVAVCCSMKRQGGNNDDSDVFEELGIRDPHVYMSSIRGSASYWKQYTGDVLAMIKQLGIPSFFFTFSFDDINSVDCVNALWKAKHGPDTPDIVPDSIPYEDRKTLLNDFPIIAAKHFSMRLTKLLALLKSKSHEIFGRELLDYTIRVEFQARGSPHCHSLLWFKDSPSWESDEGIRFLESNVSCSLENEYRDLVLKYQRHRHSKTCFKNKNRVCRFSFPKAAAQDSRILNETETHNNRGKFFELKRSEDEAMINYYHPVLLNVLKCNMDIQPVTGANAVAYYIGKYMAKAEPSDIRPEVQDAIKTIQNSSAPTREKMLKISMTIMRSREICAQEAAFRLCHLFLRKSTRSTVFIPTFKKENRIRMLKKEAFMQEVPEFCLNIIDRYMARPPCLEQLCLFEFAAHWAPYRKADPSNNDEDVQEFPDEEPQPDDHDITLRLSEKKGEIKKRTRPAVVKYPNFNPLSDRDSYYYSLILLYLPFRLENFCDDRPAAQVFQERHKDFRSHSNDSIIRTALVTEIDQALLREADFSQDVAAEPSGNPDFSMDYVERQDSRDVISLNDIFPPTNPCDNEGIVHRIRQIRATLTPEQLLVFDRLRHNVETNPSKDTDPGDRLFVSSEGGCGKTYLINLISMYLRNYLGPASVLIAAPTGKAAMLLPNGITLHSAFSLPIQFKSTGTYHKLGAKKLAEYRHLYKDVRYLVIDEISMCSYQSLRMIHMRLCEIFGNDNLFGGINVYLLGDLFQLPPCYGNLIFRKPEYFAAEVDLWRQFDFQELKVNMRQSENNPLLGILSKLRKGETDLDDIKVLETRLLGPPNSEGRRAKEEQFRNAIRIFAKNSDCYDFNEKRTQELEESGIRVFTIRAKDTYADGIHFGKECNKKDVPNKESNTGGIVSRLRLGIGSRVMLRRNINVRQKLANGAIGTVTNFRWSVDDERQVQSGDLPKEIEIKFDHLDEPQWIRQVTVEFSGKYNNCRVARVMIPLIVCYSVTCHKIQGSTLDQAVIDLGPSLFAKGMAYTALSRVRSLEGLLISQLSVTKLITTNTFSPANLCVYDEYDRLRGHEMVPRK